MLFFEKISAVSNNIVENVVLKLKDEKQNPIVRCEAMKALGKSRKNGLVKDILSIASADSLCFVEACFTALETFHHYGCH